MAWIYLLLAGICEMSWAIGFEYTNGFKTNHAVGGLTLVMMVLSFALLGQATSRGIHMGTAYAVWTGIGATGTAIIGMILFKEPRDALRLACLAVIIVGVAGLKFFSPGKGV